MLGEGKRLGFASGIDIASGTAVRGYEMHLGVTDGPGLARPMLRLGDRTEGAVSADGRVAGCYLHGLFADDPFRRAFLSRLGAAPSAFAYQPAIDNTLDRLADHLEASLDLDRLLAAARPPRLTRAA
jgi:adenosylcobyric acid synthase